MRHRGSFLVNLGKGQNEYEHKFYIAGKWPQNRLMTEEQRQIDRQKNCLDKLTWGSEEEARAAAAYSEWQRGEAKLKPYSCKYCNKWHLARAIED